MHPWISQTFSANRDLHFLSLIFFMIPGFVLCIELIKHIRQMRLLRGLRHFELLGGENTTAKLTSLTSI